MAVKFIQNISCLKFIIYCVRDDLRIDCKIGMEQFKIPYHLYNYWKAFIICICFCGILTSLLFLRKLKLVGLANNYIWSIFYEKQKIKNGEISGYLLIGDYPHLSINYPDSNKYNYSLNYIDAEVYNKKIVQTKFLMHNAQIIKDEKVLISDETFYVNLDYNFGGIILPDKFKLYFEDNIFSDKNLCHKDNVTLIFKDTFYYCNNDENTINYLKNTFPIIKLENKLLNSSFVINVNNLLYIKDNYIYILLIFEETNHWTLGIPFLKEYQFSINY